MRQKEEKKREEKWEHGNRGKMRLDYSASSSNQLKVKVQRKLLRGGGARLFVDLCFFLSVPHLLLVGVHNWCVLQTKLEGWKIKVQRPHGCATSQQPDGQQDLDPRYFLPQWQKVSGAQHDHAKQASANHRGRHTTLYHEVGQCILLHWCNKDFKRN